MSWRHGVAVVALFAVDVVSIAVVATVSLMLPTPLMVAGLLVCVLGVVQMRERWAKQ